MGAAGIGKRQVLKALLVASLALAALPAWRDAAVPEDRGEATAVFYVE